MTEAFRLAGIIFALCLGALVVDYAAYFQATMFTTLDGSGKGMDANYRTPPYHPFAHPILWALMSIILVLAFLLVAFGVGSELMAWTFAVALGAFLVARYSLLRRGIS